MPRVLQKWLRLKVQTFDRININAYYFNQIKLISVMKMECHEG
jgi:hypothetical protein